MEMNKLLIMMTQMMFGKTIVRKVSIIDLPAALFSKPFWKTPNSDQAVRRP